MENIDLNISPFEYVTRYEMNITSSAMLIS